MNRKEEVLDICKALDVETLKLIDPLIDKLFKNFAFYYS